MKHLNLLIADYVFGFAREKTDNLNSVLKTYSNKNLSTLDQIGLYCVTVAFSVQALCKRLTKDEREEGRVLKETLFAMKESIVKNGGKKEVIDMVEKIIGQCEVRLSRREKSTMPLFYTSSLILTGIDPIIAENYIKQLIDFVETLCELYEKTKTKFDAK